MKSTKLRRDYGVEQAPCGEIFMICLWLIISNELGFGSGIIP